MALFVGFVEEKVSSYFLRALAASQQNVLLTGGLILRENMAKIGPKLLSMDYSLGKSKR